MLPNPKFTYIGFNLFVLLINHTSVVIYVSVCVCVREREGVCVCVRERESVCVCERESVCVCV